MCGVRAATTVLGAAVQGAHQGYRKYARNRILLHFLFREPSSLNLRQFMGGDWVYFVG